MSEIVDRSIAELRAIHDRLAGLVTGLSPDELSGQSGAEDWPLHGVLSHLGSGAEITRYGLLGAIGAEIDPPSNQEIWDRWNALPPAERASSFVESDEALVAAYEGLTPEQRETTEIDLGFMPQPVSLATTLGMRLNEAALHGWDVEVGLDPAAALSEESAQLQAEHFSSTMSFMLGFVGKPEGVGPARVGLGDFTVVIADAVQLEAGADDTTATFEGPLEAGIRLLAGRLKPEHTPADVTVSGNITLDELRTVFPGY